MHDYDITWRMIQHYLVLRRVDITAVHDRPNVSSGMRNQDTIEHPNGLRNTASMSDFGGWSTVREYDALLLKDDSEDEKKFYLAENKAKCIKKLKMYHVKNVQNSSSNSRRPVAAMAVALATQV